MPSYPVEMENNKTKKKRQKGSSTLKKTDTEISDVDGQYVKIEIFSFTSKWGSGSSWSP